MSDIKKDLAHLSKLSSMKENTANGLKSAAIDCMEKFQPVVENKIDEIDSQLRNSGLFAFVFRLFGFGKQQTKSVEVSVSTCAGVEIKAEDNRTSLLGKVKDDKSSSLARTTEIGVKQTGKKVMPER